MPVFAMRICKGLTKIKKKEHQQCKAPGGYRFKQFEPRIIMSWQDLSDTSN